MHNITIIKQVASFIHNFACVCAHISNAPGIYMSILS